MKPDIGNRDLTAARRLGYQDALFDVQDVLKEALISCEPDDRRRLGLIRAIAVITNLRRHESSPS